MHDAFDISYELAVLHRLAAQATVPEPPRRRSPWPAIGAITIALGTGGAAYAARSSHVIAPGETLYRIAGRHLGNPTRWVEIAALNGIQDPTRIQAGRDITLPDPGERIVVRPTRSEAAARRRTAARPASDGGRNAALRRDRARTASRTDGPRTPDGVRIVPPGQVVLELPARNPEGRTAAGSTFVKPPEAEGVRPRLEADLVAPLPAPPAPAPASPWSALDGTAFLVGALGATALLTRTRNPRRSSNPARQTKWAQPEAPNWQWDFWGALRAPELGRLAPSTT